MPENVLAVRLAPDYGPPVNDGAEPLFIWISGQVAQNSKGDLVGKGDLKIQLNQAWTNVKLALAGSGATFQDVVKVTTYVVNYQPSMRDDLRAARLRFMGPGEPPAATLVGVQSLASTEWLVKIEVTTVIRQRVCDVLAIVEDRATAHAKHSAKEFLKQVIAMQPIAFSPSIQQFEGDLLIKWQLRIN